ncbi:TrkH family potassium uptake protein [Nisaea acidiphila]|uniref:Trk system potassium uptake protein n=1 Tax=Nisaea acidiphila TaxID=1862145 RepID=A0A9J7ASS0_9PROT|nr:TrkH family potassium uptake protein [Nisaea acidiphila]UUX49388.1 TrkH family potassium uptake protein [Nisaea acidiphila]
MQIKFVFHIVGIVVLGSALAALLPMLVDLMAGNPDWKVFASSAAFMGFVSISMILATWSERSTSMSLRTAFLLTGMSWMVLPLFTALPFLGLGHGYADAVFEATSGLTTTGSTVFSGLDALPPGMLLWRSLLQWIGGIGILAMAVVLLPFMRIGGSQLFRSESSDTSEKVEARWSVLMVDILLIYLCLTALCTMVFWGLGMSGFDAVCHAMATISTGGFSTHDASFGYFEGAAMQWAGTLFMLSGAVPFFLYIKAARGNRLAMFRDSQVIGLVGFLCIVSLLAGIWLHQRSEANLFEAITLTFFNVTSIVTTTGFASTDYTRWGAGAIGLFLVLTFVGGCSGSTSGGIKIYRFQVLLLVIKAHVKRLTSPHRIVPTTFNGRPLPEDAAFAVLAFLALFVATIAVSTVMLTFLGLDLVTSYSASVTAITNVGPGLGPVIGPSGTFESLPESAKFLLSFVMILGRLEIFTVLVAFDRDFWKA